MSILTNFAMNAIMKTSHPEVDRKQCWNLRPHKDKCTLCMDVCPAAEDIFSRPGMVKDWTSCTDCGLCVSACKTRCIAPSENQVTRDSTLSEVKNDTVWIGCEQSTRQNDRTAPCVSALPWEALAYTALCKKVVLDLTPCGECENEPCAERLRAMLTRTLEFLGAELFAARITLAYDAETAPYVQQTFSRRELAEKLKDGSSSSTKRLLRRLPGLEEEDRGHAQDYAILLHQLTKELKEVSKNPLHYGLYLPVVTDKCYGCGRCERSCRAGALKIVDGEDGFSRVVVTPWKCSECGQCAASCLQHGMDGMELRQVTGLGPVSVKKFKKVLCKECGKPVQPDCADGVCRVCVARLRTKKRQEEAAERAKERAARIAAEKQALEAETAAKAPAELAAAASAATASAPGKPAPTEAVADTKKEAAAPETTEKAAETAAAVQTAAPEA